MATDLHGQKIPSLSTGQMREVDRLMIEEYGIALIQMMESAGRHLAHLARSRFLGGEALGCEVVVLAGTGGNGGGGLVCARWLSNWGARVTVLPSGSGERMGEVPRHQLAILERMGVTIRETGNAADIPPAGLIVDALVGYSLRGAPRGATAALVRAANAHEAPILSLDVPSGVDSTTGQVYDPAIRASATMTLALPKEGLSVPQTREQVGELYLADIGVPPRLYARPSLGLEVGPIFAREEILRLR